jgi:hypothetical protein
MLNENNCLNCAEYKDKTEPRVGLQEVCRKLDTVIQLLKDLQVNLNINGDMRNVTVFDDGTMQVNRRRD